jgi:hypothetical protein
MAALPPAGQGRTLFPTFKGVAVTMTDTPTELIEAQYKLELKTERGQRISRAIKAMLLGLKEDGERGNGSPGQAKPKRRGRVAAD